LTTTAAPVVRRSISASSEMPSRALYPRMRMAGRKPARLSRSAIQATMGVLPVPPAVRLPTEITGTGALCALPRPTRYMTRRRRTAHP